jgi:hypothetical protein
VILGSICGLRNTNQIRQWASSGRVSEFLSKHFLINTIPYKTKTATKRPISKLMFDCLLEPENILSVLTVNEN